MGQTSEAVRQSVRLVITDSDGDATVVPVLGRRFLIGRSRSCQLRSRNQLVSREHAAIEDQGGALVLRDLGSRNGTLWNGKRVHDLVRLRDGDRVQVGPLVFTVTIHEIEDAPGEPASTEDHVASWLIDEASPPGPDPSMSNSGGVTHVGDSNPGKRRSMRPL